MEYFLLLYQSIENTTQVKGTPRLRIFVSQINHDIPLYLPNLSTKKGKAYSKTAYFRI